MPIFEIESDGKVFQVDAPDQASALDALSSMPSAPENSLAGSAKALGSGLVGGAASLAGLPADLLDLGSRGFDYVTGKKSNESIAPAVKPYGGEAFKRRLEGVTGELYKPQTTLEKYLHTAGEFAPAALMGPGGIARRVGANVLAPAVASETAGQLTEGTSLEPVARVAGALGGAVGGSKIANALTKPRAPAVPSMDDIAASKRSLYDSPDIKDVRLAPKAVEAVINRIEKNLKAEYLDAPATYRLLDAAKKPMNGPNHSLQDLDNIRRRLNETAAAGGSEGEAARRAVTFLTNIEPHWGKIPGAVIKGDIRAAAGDLQAARANAAVGFRHKKVEEVLEKAANTATATHSGGNLENEIYKAVRTMLNNPKKHLRGWTKEEIAELKSVLPGLGRNALRRVGKLFGGGGGLGQLASGGAGGAMFGFPGMVALPAIGVGANKLGSSLAQRKLQGVGETLRARSPLYGSANQAQRQAQISGGGLLSGIPRNEQLALQALIAANANR